jgi:phosphatidylcholine synthase
LLALEAIDRGEWRLALLWLLAALAVDGVDGTLARWARVKDYAPRIDGEAFDLIVDYLNYVFVPAVFIVRAELVPAGLALPLAAAILLSSVYVFVRRDMKTNDNYFRGFPALWNVVALYLFVAQPGPAIGAIAVILFAILSFAPHSLRPPLPGARLPAPAAAAGPAVGGGDARPALAREPRRHAAVAGGVARPVGNPPPARTGQDGARPPKA